MILSNKDIKELMEDKDQPTLVRYLATRIVNMAMKLGELNFRCDQLAGALTHIGAVAAKKIHEDSKRYNESILEQDTDED